MFYMCVLERMPSLMEILVRWKVPLKVCQVNLPFNSNLHHQLQSWSWISKVLVFLICFFMFVEGLHFCSFVRVLHKCIFVLIQMFIELLFVSLLFSICQHFAHCVCVLLCSVLFHLIASSRWEPELPGTVSGSSSAETHTALPPKALSLLLTDRHTGKNITIRHPWKF